MGPLEMGPKSDREFGTATCTRGTIGAGWGEP